MEMHTLRFLKKRNVLTVLNAINQEKKLSRAQLARHTNLTPATISNIVSKLEKAKIVRLIGPSESRRGRRPVMLQFNPNAFYLAGLDFGLSKAIAVIIDLHGNVLQKEHIPLSKKISRESVVQILIDLVERIRTSNPQIGDKIKGIGISYPGLVDTESGTGLVAPNWPELNNLPLVRILQEKLNLFVCIENDGACMTLGQARFGVGLGSKNILGIILGRGIGAGIIINGGIYHGLSSTAGEFGHLTVIPNGPTCGCGNQGCLEVVASGEAIASSAVRLIQSGRAAMIQDKIDGKLDNISAKIVAEAAAEGDVLAKELMMQAANYIGIALADVINILNPELVIFAGGLSASGKYFLDSIKETARKRAYTFGVFRQPKFSLAEFGENANCIGAAALVLENMLDVDFQGTWGLPLSSKTVSQKQIT